MNMTARNTTPGARCLAGRVLASTTSRLRQEPRRSSSSPGGTLEAQTLEPIRVTEVLKPVAVTNPRPGIFMVDSPGSRTHGSRQLNLVAGPAGTEVRIRTSFNVTPEGLLNFANDRSANNLDIYTLKGQGDETWHPRFKGNATRYVQVEGFPGTPTVENFEGLVTHTDMEQVGQFACSNALINRIYQNARWGTRMQNRSVPMEPDRDERMPWSGHPAKTSESEGYAFNVARFYDHFLHNYRTHQGEDGSLQEILPPYWTFNSKDIIWPSVITIIPDWYFNFYGDLRPLADNFECMKRWVLFHQKAYQKPDYTIDFCNYGDWSRRVMNQGDARQAEDVALPHVVGLLLQQLPNRRRAPRRAAGKGG